MQKNISSEALIYVGQIQVHSYGAVHLHTGTANILIFLENHYLYNKNDLRIH
jgi:UDP-galactopyranose mutase